MESVSVEAVWPAVVEDVRQRFGRESAVDRWLGMMKFLGEDETSVHLGVANRFVLEWFEKKYLAGLREILGARLRRPVTVVLRVDPGLFRELRADQERVLGAVRSGRAADRRDVAGPAGAVGAGTPRDRGDRPARFSLDAFAVGESNRSAWRAAMEVVADRGPSYNPLFVFGPTGVGKTHLLRGLDVRLATAGRGRRSRYLGGERFLNSFVFSLKEGTIKRFREELRGLDVLILDDFQLLCGKKKTEQEFLHTLDAVINRGGQVIVAGTRHPRCMETLDPSLTSRLLSGLVVTVCRPDYATRLEILRLHARRFPAAVSDEVLALVAERVRGNAGELIGAANQVSAALHFDVPGRGRIDVERVSEIVDEVYRDERTRFHLEDILGVVSGFYRTRAELVRSGRRDRTVARARHVAMFLCRRYTDHSLAEIGAFFGKRNSSTVRSAEQKIRRLVESGDAVRSEIRELTDILHGSR